VPLYPSVACVCRVIFAEGPYFAAAVFAALSVVLCVFEAALLGPS